MTAAAVAVERLRKTFEEAGRGTVVAVDEVSFECRPGEVLGLLGVNGAGKTTTLRMLSTVLRPTSGSATILGHDLVRAPASVRASIGFLSASTALYGRLTPAETLRFFAEVNGVPRAEVNARVDKLLHRFELEAVKHTQVEKLSSGMRQRVSIARTIVHDPRVLIIDEPTVGLDVLAAASLLEAISGLRDEGKAILFSTHIMSEAEKLCDRIAILNEGKILACATLAEHRASVGLHYLEDVFLSYVREAKR